MYTIVNDDEVLVGSIVAERYHVRDVIGQGSTGTVFGLEHLSFGRAAAMKVLRPRYTSLDTVRQVFQGETRAALAVGHPSLCEVFDLGILPDGAPFYVMERLEGETLAARLLRGERFSAAAAVDLIMQLLAAMDALHERKILLRDLRPQNVFLAQRRGCRPVVKVMDVGLTRLLPLERVQAEWDALRAMPHLSDSGGLVSIPCYLSPERTRGEHGLEPSNDVFVAAVLLYEMLAGQRPFMARTWAGLVQQIANARPTPLQTLRPDLPDELDALVMRALSANPRARPSSARELQDELRAAFESGTRRAPTSERSERAADPQTRTDRRHIDATLAARLSAFDEASADNPLRTVRPPQPPQEIDVEVDLYDVDAHANAQVELPAVTARGTELETTLDIAWPASAPIPRESEGESEGESEEETATMQLNPELRARIDELTKRASTPPVVSETRPPPTHPIRTPRQR